MHTTPSRSPWRFIAPVIDVLLLVTAGVMLYYLRSLQLLPNRYFLAAVGGILLLLVLTGLLLHRRKYGKWEKKPGWLKQIFGCILACFLLTVFCAGTYFLSTLSGTLNSITTTDNTVHVLLEVYVRSDDPAQYLQDARNYIFAVSDSTEEEDNQAAIADLEAALGGSVTVIRYRTTFEMVDALFSGDVGAMVMDSSYLSILDGQEGYTDFDTRVRLLHEYVITKEPVAAPGGEHSMDGNYIAPLKDPSTTPFLVYLSGNDARRLLLADGGSDSNILIAVNPVDHQILMINTPRDYYVVNPASGDGSRDKLSHCGLKGIDNCVQAITGLYGIPINYYARINFTGLRTLIDAIGGVDVYSEVGFSSGRHYFREGNNHLNGTQALAFVRARKPLAGGDNDRGKNQMKVVEAIIYQLTSGSLLTNYGQIMDSLEGMFTTNMSPAHIAKLVQFQLLEKPDWEIFTFAVTGDGGSDFCWAAGGNGYVMYPHENMVDHAVFLMQKVLSGEKLVQEDLTVK